MPHNAGVSRDGGSESYSERTALQNKWTKEVEITDNKKRKVCTCLRMSQVFFISFLFFACVAQFQKSLH